MAPLPRPTFAAWLWALFLPISPCSSLFSPFFTLFRAILGFDHLPRNRLFSSG
jgi:hypothetical protein